MIGGYWVSSPSLLIFRHSVPTYNQFDPDHPIPTVWAFDLAEYDLRQAKSVTNLPEHPYAERMYRTPFAFWLTFLS